MALPDRAIAPLGELDLPDHLRPGLAVVFAGINPGEQSARSGRHYAHPTNRFYRALHEAGLTPRLLAPEEDHLLPDHGIGLTNLAGRPTRQAAELERGELVAGLDLLAAKLRRHRPRLLVVNGKGAWETATGRPCTMGLQPDPLAGVPVYVAPSPSGRNAAYGMPSLIEHYRAARRLSREIP